MAQTSSSSTHLPTHPHTHTIILLHGRGSSASTFHSELFESQDSSDAFFPSLFPSIKWVFPCAPLRWACIESEMVHQWFDMTSVQRPWEDADMQREGLEESAEYVARVIKEEVEKVGEDRVIVGGISQGCALGAYVLVTRGFRVGGFLGLSGRWPGMVGEKENAGHVRDVPMLLQHCRDDDVVPVENGEELMRRLEERGMMVRWECFEEGKHWLNEPEGMDGIVRFIREVIEISKSVGRDVD